MNTYIRSVWGGGAGGANRAGTQGARACMQISALRVRYVVQLCSKVQRGGHELFQNRLLSCMCTRNIACDGVASIKHLALPLRLVVLFGLCQMFGLLSFEYIRIRTQYGYDSLQS